MAIKFTLKGKTPLKSDFKKSIIGLVGGFLTIGVLLWLTKMAEHTLIMAPFGASCVLAFGVWDSPLSQPRNIIGGHLISTATGLACQQFLGSGAYSVAFATGMAIFLMMMTKTTHPPAGADALVVMMAGQGWNYLFSPVLIGSVIIVLMAVIINNLVRGRAYPSFWW